MPTELMQAAMTAINNRNKVNSIDRKSKGKAPIPPARGEYDEPIDNVDHVSVKSEIAEMPPSNAMSKDGSQPDLGKCFVCVCVCALERVNAWNGRCKILLQQMWKCCNSCLYIFDIDF